MLSAIIRLLVIAVLHAGGSLAQADETVSAPTASLRAKYAALLEQLDHSQFQKPLYLDSIETEDRLQGELYGVLDDPFASTQNSLKLASQWCDISSPNAPPHEQLEVRLRDWFASTERHALQLHELSQNEYLDMKRRQYQQANGR